MTRSLTVLIALAGLAVPAGAVHANPRALPFTYTSDTLAAGHAELEQTVDLVPLRGLSPANGEASYLASTFQTELEIGLTDRLELGLYLSLAPTPNPSLIGEAAKLPGGTGLKQRLRYSLAPPGEWPIDVGLYGEIAETTFEIELEAKLLLQRRFGKLRVAANLWAEYELYFERGQDGSHQRDLVLHPTLGATYEITPRLSVGVDSWVRGEYPTNPKPARRTFGLGPAAYVGPALMMSFGKVWWTVAAYGRVTDVNHDLAPGEPYGKLWARTMIGYDL